jgi:hypothetical protein
MSHFYTAKYNVPDTTMLVQVRRGGGQRVKVTCDCEGKWARTVAGVRVIPAFLPCSTEYKRKRVNLSNKIDKVSGSTPNLDPMKAVGLRLFTAG